MLWKYWRATKNTCERNVCCQMWKTRKINKKEGRLNPQYIYRCLQKILIKEKSKAVKTWSSSVTNGSWWKGQSWIIRATKAWTWLPLPQAKIGKLSISQGVYILCTFLSYQKTPTLNDRLKIINSLWMILCLRVRSWHNLAICYLRSR